MVGLVAAPEKFYALYIVIQYEKGVYKSLGKVSKIVKSDLERYIKVMSAHLHFKDNQYFITQVSTIHFCFKPRPFG